MGTVSQSFYNDLRSARSAEALAKKPIVVERLTKAGVPSKMREDTLRFSTIADADAYVARIKALNPKTTFNFRITDTTQPTK